MYPCMPLRASEVHCCVSECFLIPRLRQPALQTGTSADCIYSWKWSDYHRGYTQSINLREGGKERIWVLCHALVFSHPCIRPNQTHKHKKKQKKHGPARFLSEDVVPESILVFQFQSILSAQIKYSGRQLKMMSLSRSCPNHSALHRQMHVCVCERIR